MTGNELIARLQALPADQRARPVGCCDHEYGWLEIADVEVDTTQVWHDDTAESMQDVDVLTLRRGRT